MKPCRQNKKNPQNHTAMLLTVCSCLKDDLCWSPLLGVNLCNKKGPLNYKRNFIDF